MSSVKCRYLTGPISKYFIFGKGFIYQQSLVSNPQKAFLTELWQCLHRIMTCTLYFYGGSEEYKNGSVSKWSKFKKVNISSGKWIEFSIQFSGQMVKYFAQNRHKCSTSRCGVYNFESQKYYDPFLAD